MAWAKGPNGPGTASAWEGRERAEAGLGPLAQANSDDMDFRNPLGHLRSILGTLFEPIRYPILDLFSVAFGGPDVEWCRMM